MSKTKSKVLFHITDMGSYTTSETNVEGLSKARIRRIQATLIRAAVGLEEAVEKLTPKGEHIYRQIDVSKVLAVKTTQAEVDDGEAFCQAAQIRVIEAIENCEIELQDEDVTDEWLLEDLEELKAEDAQD